MKQNISVKEILFDLKFLAEEIYCAKISEENGAIKILFDSSETFLITAKKLCKNCKIKKAVKII